VPSQPVIDTTPPASDFDTTPTFTFHDTSGQTGITLQCSVDSTSNFNTCTSPFTTNTLGNGSHTFRVRARNAEWNLTSTAASYTWTITVPGSISITIQRSFFTRCGNQSWNYSITRSSPSFNANGSGTTNGVGTLPTVGGIPAGSGSSAYTVTVSRNAVTGQATNVSVTNGNTTSVTITVSSCG